MIKFDDIGYWSELKLDIIKEYATAYSKILSAQCNPSFKHVYIDAFSGSGSHISKATGEFISGSPLNALDVYPSFKEYHFIDLNGDKIEFLKNKVGERKEVFYYTGDCNELLINSIFTRCKYTDYKRALCLLDPYGLHLNWEVIAKAAEYETIEIFINFPTMDMQRNVLWQPHNLSKVSEKNIKRMNSFWGDSSWRDIAYIEESTLFGPREKKAENIKVAQAFKKRLKEKAGFRYIAEPLPMRNRTGATIYYLFFAAQKPVAKNIFDEIFNKYKYKGFLK
ncbi:three-Cys-motif partner protein TcmP [Candidatus Latescibacterota bacterium]